MFVNGPDNDGMADTLKPIADVAADRTGRRPSPSTQYRWIRTGGLKASFVGGRWLCSPAAFDAFVAGQTAARLKPVESTPDASDAALAAAGLL